MKPPLCGFFVGDTITHLSAPPSDRSITPILQYCFPFGTALTCREHMKTYHFFIIIFVAILLGALEFYYDQMDSAPKKPFKQVRVVYQDRNYDENYIEDDNE